MKFKNFIKTILATFIIDSLGNILLLLLFGIRITLSAIIGSLVFSLLLTLVLKILKVLKEG